MHFPKTLSLKGVKKVQVSIYFWNMMGGIFTSEIWWGVSLLLKYDGGEGVLWVVELVY